MKKTVAVVALLVAVSGFPGLSEVEGSRATASESPWTLSAADIDAALRLGRFGEPAPYFLRVGSIYPTQPPGKQRGGAIFAAVYTPFVRVAFASRQAWDAGQTLEARDLNAKLTDRVVYVAFDWMMDTHPEWDPFTVPYPVIGWTPFPMIYRGRDSDAGVPPLWRRTIPPLWSRRGGDALREFGAPPPFETVAAVAAFPASTLREHHAFVIYKEYQRRPDDGAYSTIIQWGAIWPEDLRGWR